MKTGEVLAWMAVCTGYATGDGGKAGRPERKRKPPMLLLQ
jgi:hypothetical protein